jgi:hypothetical protein
MSSTLRRVGGEGKAVPQANRPELPDREAADSVTLELRVLEKRLRDGEELLRTGRESGRDPSTLDRWESAWISLLRQYERLCDRNLHLPDKPPASFDDIEDE